MVLILLFLLFAAGVWLLGFVAEGLNLMSRRDRVTRVEWRLWFDQLAWMVFPLWLAYISAVLIALRALHLNIIWFPVVIFVTSWLFHGVDNLRRRMKAHSKQAVSAIMIDTRPPP
jgi:hypothetical protein